MLRHHPSAEIEALLLPQDPDDFYTSPTDKLELSVDPNGIVGDERYSGNTRLADVRAPAYRKKIDMTLNRQAVSFVGAEDLDYIAGELGLAPNDPATRLCLARHLGANIVLGGFKGTEETPHFRTLMPMTDFGPYDSASRKFTNATVTVTRRNEPCIAPGKKIQEAYPEHPDVAKRFVQVAQGRRGFVGMVAMDGAMFLGQSVTFIPFGER